MKTETKTKKTFDAVEFMRLRNLIPSHLSYDCSNAENSISLNMETFATIFTGQKFISNPEPNPRIFVKFAGRE